MFDKDEIIEMARKSGLETNEGFSESVFYFAKLVAAKEREACAKVCEERISYWQRDDIRCDEDGQCSAAIRARGEA